MSSARALRSSARRRRSRVLPAVSRLTVRSNSRQASGSSSETPPRNGDQAGPGGRGQMGRPARLGEALRASREALADIQRQLDGLLAAVRAPAGRPPPDAADRLRRASKRAGVAMNRLAAV